LSPIVYSFAIVATRERSVKKLVHKIVALSYCNIPVISIHVRMY